MERLTFRQIEKRFPNEWVLLEAPETDPNDTAKADGLVVLHHPDKATLHDLMRELIVDRRAQKIETPVTYKMIYAGNLNVTSRPWLNATIIPGSLKTI